MRRAPIYLAFLLIAAFQSAQAQVRLNWSTFERLKFEEVYVQEQAAWLQKPLWTEELREWDGKRVKVTGYVIALDAVSQEYALSAFPFSSCFFCGNAGPESVLELRLAQEATFLTDQVVTFEGTLRLNDDPLAFPLTLESATEQP